MKILVFPFLLLLSSGCFSQGIEGFLREARGNQMGVSTKGNIIGHPLVSKIHVFKNLSSTDLLGLEGQWCKSVEQKPYLIIQTDNKGYFKQALKKGKYVVLVEAYDGFFIPSFDQFNHPSKILVEPKKYTSLNILVNSKAIY